MISVGQLFRIWNKSSFLLYDPSILIQYYYIYSIIQVPFGSSQTVNLIRVIESQWAQTLKQEAVISLLELPQNTQAEFQEQHDRWLSGHFVEFWRVWMEEIFFSIPLSLSPTPHYCFCCLSSPADGEDWCHVTIERDTKCTKCFFHPLLLSMRTLVSGGRGGAEQTFPLLTPQAVECVPNFTYSQLRQLSTCPQWWAGHTEG